MSRDPIEVAADAAERAIESILGPPLTRSEIRGRDGSKHPAGSTKPSRATKKAKARRARKARR